MNPSSRITRRNIRRIDDEIAYLSIEDIGRTPVQVLRVIFVGVNDAKTRKSSSGLESWDVSWVADQVGIILVYDRGGD